MFTGDRSNTAGPSSWRRRTCQDSGSGQHPVGVDTGDADRATGLIPTGRIGGRNLPRRLAAIVAADAVGYSRRMELDEDATISAWLDIRSEVIDPAISAHNGRIVKHTGDGFLAEFVTIVEAVTCAMEIQGKLKQSNKGLSSEKSLEFRMGVNLGDVSVEKDDIHGDGVNIAARLEALAQPGGICISHAVYEQVHKRLEVGFADLGKRQVKNIRTPVHAYRLLTDPTKAGLVIEQPRVQAEKDRPVVCFVDDDPIEDKVFERVFGDRYQIYASNSLSDISEQMHTANVTPNLVVLDLYFTSGRDTTDDERLKMIKLKQRVDEAQQELTGYLATIGQGREGGLQLLGEVRQKYPGTPVGFFTRKGSIDDVVACLDAGASHVLKKPQPSIVDPESDILPQLGGGRPGFQTSIDDTI